MGVGLAVWPLVSAAPQPVSVLLLALGAANSRSPMQTCRDRQVSGKQACWNSWRSLTLKRRPAMATLTLRGLPLPLAVRIGWHCLSNAIWYILHYIYIYIYILHGIYQGIIPAKREMSWDFFILGNNQQINNQNNMVVSSRIRLLSLWFAIVCRIALA